VVKLENREMIRNSQRRLIKKIANKYRIKLLLMFGSQVNKKTHQLSDFDIGVLFKKNQVSFEKYSKLLDDLREIFPEKEIDLAIINNTDPLFLAKILENCQVVFGKKKDLNELKLYSFHQFCDYRKYFNLEEEFARRFIKEFR